MNKDILNDAIRAATGGAPTDCTVSAIAREYVRHHQAPTSSIYETKVGTPKTSVELAALAIEAEAAEQAAAEKQARVDQLNYQIGLATATQSLLSSIKSLDNGTVEIASQGQFSKYRKDLAPLAAAYGYRVVLVGDKSKATLSK